MRSELDKDIQKLKVWNGTVPERINRCVHSVIHDRCREQPNAQAVRAWDGDFTYNQLDELSTALATHLMNRGIGIENFVPVYFEKSKWTTVAILGVLKSGAAFVLLDPSQPLSRLQGICEDVSARIIVTSKDNIALAANLTREAVVLDSDNVAAWRKEKTPVKVTPVTPENAAYAVFTSGSTGKPKAAIIEHATYSSAAVAHGRALFLNRSSRVFQFASYAFDVSISDNLMTLVAGGCVCVPSETDRKSNISEAARRFRINRAELTPSVARLLSADDIPTLQTMILGGESMNSQDIAMWAKEVQLLNTYGPAECSVNSTVQSSVGVMSDPKNIGYGAGSVCWVVDEQDHNKLAPIGTIGELLIEGPIVGRGYLNNPEKTAAAFITNPSWMKFFRPAGYKGRLYKTGDLVKYESDGSLSILGRKDTQVKIRGQRVELGEVEHHVSQHFDAEILAEVVTPKEAGRQPYLAAFVRSSTTTENNKDGLFVLPDDHFRAATNEASTRLSNKLPPFMVPSVFLPISQIPLSPTGKADRRKLRENAASLLHADLAVFSGAALQKQMPSTESEKSLQLALSQVLKIQTDEIGMNDNFLQLGGDSITAMKLANASQQDGRKLSVADVLGSPKISDLAKKATKLEDTRESNYSPFSLLSDTERKLILKNNAASAGPLTEDNILDILPVTNFQELCIQDMPCTYFMLDIHGLIQQDRLQNACETLVRTHPTLRTVFLHHAGSVVQAVLDRVDVPFFHYDTKHGLTNYLNTLYHNDVLRVPMGMSLTQFTLIQKGRRHHTLMIRMSHAQFDGLSIQTIYNDLATAYKGDELSVKSPSFAEYVNLCTMRKTTEAFGFWRNLLDGSTMTQLQLRPAHVESSPEITAIRATGHAQTTKPPADITMAAVVKAAWAYTLANLTCKTDVVFGQLVNGRSFPASGLDSIVGACLNFVPSRVKIESHWTVLDLLRCVQDQHIQTMVHESTGFRDIVENCTSWPKGTEFGSTVQHQNIDEHPEFSVDGIEYIGAGYFHEERLRSIRILSVPDDDQLIVNLGSPSWMMDQSAAQNVVNHLCNTISDFLKHPKALIQLDSS